MNFFTHAGILTTYGGISLFPVFSVLHHLRQTSCTEILAFLHFPPYQYNTYAHHVRRNISFPDSLRTPPPSSNKLYGDFGFSPISSVPTLPWLSLRTEESLFSRFSPYSTTYAKQVVRRFWLISHFLRTSSSLTPTTYGGISLFPILSVPAQFSWGRSLWQRTLLVAKEASPKRNT